MAARVYRIDGESGGPVPEAYRLALEDRLAVAAPMPGRVEALGGEAGVAWRDEAFLEELRERDGALGVPRAARDALEALARGDADCVVAGQQPGLLGGPILLASKLACAIALARRLTRHGGRRVVPVYWCGADDSDFEETTRAWMWSLHSEPFRARLEAQHHSDGMRVGSIDGRALAALERDALEHADGAGASNWNWPDTLARLDRAADFAQRATLWVHEIFAEDGVVVVDARSRRLRDLGIPLFTRYRDSHARCTELLSEHGRQLLAEGLPLQLAEDALRSGLFTLDGERRSKLDPARFAQADPRSLAPSVLLRPLWQDSLLGPRAAVLGPAELAYHAQLAPLYHELGVRPASALPRGFLHCLPEGMVQRIPEDLHALLGGERAREQWLAEYALPDADRESLHALERGLDAATRALAESAPSVDAAMLLELRQRLSAQVQRLRQQMLPAALAGRGEAWRLPEAWSGLRGEAQERCYALASLLLRFGADDCRAAFSAFGEEWIAALDARRMPSFVALLGGGPS